MNGKLQIIENFFEGNQNYGNVVINNVTQSEIIEALKMLKISTTPLSVIGSFGSPYYVALYDQNHYDGTFAIVNGSTLYVLNLVYVLLDFDYRWYVDGEAVTNAIAGGIHGGILGAVLAPKLLGAKTTVDIVVDKLNFVFNGNGVYKGRSYIIQLAKNNVYSRQSFHTFFENVEVLTNRFMSMQKNLTFKEFIKALVTENCAKHGDTKYSAIMEFMLLQDEKYKSRYRNFIDKI